MGSHAFAEYPKLRRNFISNELIYGTEIRNVDLKVRVATRDYLAQYKAGRMWIEFDFVPLANIHSYLSAKVQVLKRPLVGADSKDLNLHVGRHQRKRSVLVDGHELVKNPERMTFETGISSLVRLQRFDNRHCSGQDIPNLILGKARLGTDREARLSTRAIDVKARETPSKLVQSRSQAVGKISDNRGDFKRHRFALNANNMLLLSRVVLGTDEVRFRFPSGTQYGVDFVQVMFCPNGLQFQVG